ncbi:MAG TPA: M48 family metalloprotease [Abditibacteriaceae bacterium]|jgi:Zn-dependent protease with chaperone function
MQKEQFEALVRKLEVVAQQNPKAYKNKIIALALLGYGYILFVLSLLLASLGALIYFAVRSHHAGYAVGKIGLLLLGLIYVVVRSLWVKIEPPAGLPLTRERVPALFNLIDEVALKLQSPKPNVVLLTDDFNCAIAQIPRLGVFGWYKSYLILGLPMLQAIAPDEFKAILAHEFGHLSGNHGRFSGWIYRIRASWYQLMESLRDNHGAALFGWFFNWYAPYFGACSFVLARADEYVADGCAVEIAGSRASADALLRTTITGTYLQEKFWPSVLKQADVQAVPPAPFINLKSALKEYEIAPAQRWINRALNEKTGETDTHPSLTDRLNAIKETPRLPPELARTAGEEYLGTALDEITQTMNSLWSQSVGPAWQERHKEQQEARAKLRDLTEKEARDEELSEAEQLQMALWREEFEGEEAALQSLEQFVVRFPNNVAGNFSLGRLLLEKEDENEAKRGISLLEKAMELDAEATLPACQLIYTYLCDHNQGDEAERYLQKAVVRGELEYEAAVEREGLSPTDTFLPHEVSPEKLSALQAALAEHPRIKEVYLTRKQLSHEGPPLYVLGILFEFKMLQIEDEEKCRQWASELSQSLPLPGECFVLPLHGNLNTFKKPLEKMEAKIYSKP